MATKSAKLFAEVVNKVEELEKIALITGKNRFLTIIGKAIKNKTLESLSFDEFFTAMGYNRDNDDAIRKPWKKIHGITLKTAEEMKTILYPEKGKRGPRGNKVAALKQNRDKVHALINEYIDSNGKVKIVINGKEFQATSIDILFRYVDDGKKKSASIGSLL
ncbi:MAG: hypothetical protein GW949_10000 [Spirochaetales bacterium]|nr:hypothetical protein [Spirochaetales bacterium]